MKGFILCKWMDYFLFAETWSLFQTGWFDLPEEWNDPCILDTIQPLLDIREHLSDILVSEPSMEFDVMIYASSLLYTNLQVRFTFEPRHGISNNVVCATSKGSGQPERTCSLIRAFASGLNILLILGYWPNIIWSF